jgi:protocatechuate 3,4-dioxygenase beta subunit
LKNSKNWNRVLTGAAAVSLAIGTLAPMAFAASATTQYNTRTMNVGSGFTAVVQGLVAQDQGHATEFLPIYYLMQGLGKLGYTVNWNGGTRVLNITTPTGVTVTAPTATVGTPGADQMVIQLNGANVMLAPRVVAKDPASGVMTTFAPIYYLNQALKSAGFTNTYNGSSWTLTGTAASQSTSAALSNITVANATNGNGSGANPAVSLNNAAMNLSVTLKDANGNPIPNTAITFNVSNYGSISNINLPTVANASGAFIAPQTGTNAYEYTAYTDASGVAAITMTGPAGSTNLYEVQASAPYAGSNNSSMNSQPAYAEFVAGNTVGLSPYGSYNAALGTPVPITVTLPPNSAGQPQSGVLTTLQSSGSGYFTNATGADLGTQVSVVTNSSGIAQTYYTDSTQNNDTVSVEQSSLPSGLTAPTAVTINFAQSGIPAKIQNFSMTATSVSSGQDVTVYGTLVDSAGNPVPNGQILVVGNSTNQGTVNSSNNNNADLEYVTGSGSSATTTGFPNAGAVTTLASGTPGSTTGISMNNGATASTAVGEMVTADSAGNFSFVLTDSHDNETSYFSIYAVSNGQVVNSTTPTTANPTLPGEPLYSDSVNFNTGVAASIVCR